MSPYDRLRRRLQRHRRHSDSDNDDDDNDGDGDGDVDDDGDNDERLRRRPTKRCLCVFEKFSIDNFNKLIDGKYRNHNEATPLSKRKMSIELDVKCLYKDLVLFDVSL